MSSEELLKLREKTRKLRQDADEMEANLKTHFDLLGLTNTMGNINEEEIQAGMQAMAEKYKMTQPSPRLPFSQVKPKPISKPNSQPASPAMTRPISEKANIKQKSSFEQVQKPPTKPVAKSVTKAVMKPRPLSGRQTADSNIQGLSISGVQISGKK